MKCRYCKKCTHFPIYHKIVCAVCKEEINDGNFCNTHNEYESLKYEKGLDTKTKKLLSIICIYKKINAASRKINREESIKYNINKRNNTCKRREHILYLKENKINKRKRILKRKEEERIEGRKIKLTPEYIEQKRIDFNKKHNEYQKNRRKTDISYKLALNIRTRLWWVLKTGYKSRTIPNLLGCSIEFFKGYIEGKFTNGMTWDNYGKTGWEMDHILPCAKFDLTNEIELHQCFHYSNYQPLWSRENAIKNDRVILGKNQIRLAI